MSRPCLSSLVEPVEFLSSPVEAGYMWRRVELLSRAVEGCRVSMSRLSSYVECAVELMSSSRMACSFAILHEAL
jgi:hypothetical protein